MNKLNKKGIALILGFIVITVLTILGSAIVSRSISESNISRRYSESTQAFWLAEAGLNRALKELKSNYTTSGNCLWPANLGEGRYCADVEIVGDDRWVTSHGFVPATTPAAVERRLKAVMNKYIPPNFYDNAIYSSGEVDFNGNSYNVTGDILYADSIEYSQNNVNGNITQDSSISPLALLDFQQLYTISQGQQNVYVKSGNNLVNQATGSQSFPSSFWYAPGVPNVVYVESDLELKGNIRHHWWFFCGSRRCDYQSQRYL